MKDDNYEEEDIYDACKGRDVDKWLQDNKKYQKGDYNLNIFKDTVSIAPKVKVEECTIEPYMTNEEGGTCWCIKAGDRVLAVSNKAGCEQFLESIKKTIADGK